MIVLKIFGILVLVYLWTFVITLGVTGGIDFIRQQKVKALIAEQELKKRPKYTTRKPKPKNKKWNNSLGVWEEE